MSFKGDSDCNVLVEHLVVEFPVKFARCALLKYDILKCVLYEDEEKEKEEKENKSVMS